MAGSVLVVVEHDRGAIAPAALEALTAARGFGKQVDALTIGEVAFDGVQTSRRYPGGLALRFARVKGYRPDKSAAEADTIDAVRAIHG